MNLEMFKLDLEKAEEPEIKLPTSIGLLKKQENSRKTFISALLTVPKALTVWITTNWKILQEMGIPDHFTYLLRNLYVDHEQTEMDTEQVTGSKLRREYDKTVYYYLAYLTLYAEYIMQNARLDESQAEINIARRSINNSDMQMIPL